MGKLRRVALVRALHIASKYNISPNLFEVSLNISFNRNFCVLYGFLVGGEKGDLNVISHIASVN